MPVGRSEHYENVMQLSLDNVVEHGRLAMVDQPTGGDMSNSKIRDGWHTQLALQRVIEFMAVHGHNAASYADMVDHDAIDFAAMRDDMAVCRKYGRTFVQMFMEQIS